MSCNEKQPICHSGCLPKHATYNINNLNCCCCNKESGNNSTQLSFGVPIGTIIAFPVLNIPEDYLECNGAEIEREAYAELFEVIGEAYGAGDGETTFNLPDLRGEFIRGLDNGREIDSGRVLGSWQEDKFKSHTHTIISSVSAYSTGVKLASGANHGSDPETTSSVGGSETRPRNVAMIYCIKAKLDQGIVTGGAGTDGKSAYEVAVANGFVGAEVQWLDSLKGKSGTDGQPGKDGISPTIIIVETVTGEAGTPAEVKNIGTKYDAQLQFTIPRGRTGSSDGYLPPGVILYFANETPPDGWLKADGAAISRSVFPELFAVIGTKYGEGNGDTTFNLPDLRGEFLRCFDDGRGIDNEREFGSAQGDAIRNITGEFKVRGLSGGIDYPSGVFSVRSVSSVSAAGAGTANVGGGYGVFDVSRVVPTANENRPRNVALLACIKY